MTFAHTPRDTDAKRICALALESQRKGDVARAEDLYRGVLRGNPDYTQALVNLGVILKEHGRYDAALSLYKRAQTLTPNDHRIAMNIGNTLLLQGDYLAALECFESLIATAIKSADVYYNRGLVLHALHRFPEAIFSFERALSIEPTFALAEWNKALTLLTMGSFREGFSSFESRWKLPAVHKNTFSKPQWTGSSPENKTILVYAEESLSDTLFFARFLPLLKERGATINLHCQAELVPLLQNSSLADTVHSLEDTPLQYDYHASLLSLPFLLGVTEEEMAVYQPYIYAANTETPLEFLHAPADAVKVGLFWDETTTLAPLLPLLTVPNTYFYSVQQDATLSLQHHGVQGIITDSSPFVRDTLDLATLIDQLDVIVTVDSTIAHLAASMGIRVWLIVASVGDWRWGFEGDTTKLYPTMRLFRQQSVGQWHDVSTQLVQRLQGLVG
jgi:tetratricopeptide (TPR) repeat protein